MKIGTIIKLLYDITYYCFKDDYGIVIKDTSKKYQHSDGDIFKVYFFRSKRYCDVFASSIFAVSLEDNMMVKNEL